MTDNETPTGWLLSLPRRPAPEFTPCTPAIQSEKDRLLALWTQFVDPVDNNGDGDVEDFFEGAARLDAAISSFGAENLWHYDFSLDGTVTHLTSRENRHKSEFRDLPRYGPQERGSEFDQANTGERHAPRYGTKETFVRNAGREVRLSSNFDGEGRIVDDVLDISTRSNGRVIVKASRAKHGLWDLTVPAGSTRDQTYTLLMGCLGWSMVSEGDMKDAFLIQAWVPMSYEYRLFVIDGVIVTGAGCIEEFTPLNNRQPFDHAVREDRAGHSPVEDRPDVVATLIEFGKRVIEEFRIETPEMKSYVLDVALGAGGLPLIIELNELLNSGLYASDPKLVTNAMAANRT